MKKRVLITGATGFVGYHLIEAALKQDLEVYANVRQSSSTDHLRDLDIRYVDLDFSTVETLKQHIEEYKYDYIIHAAATTKAKNLQQYIKINADYARNLAKATVAATHKIEKFVFVSSLAAVGPLEMQNEIITDNAEPKPVTFYGISKAKAEDYLSQIDGLPLIIIRPTAVYGPREKDLFILFKSIRSGLELYIGKQEQKLSFIYVTDLAKLIIKTLGSEIKQKAYNISDGKVYDRFSLARYSKMALKTKTLTVQIPVGIIKGVAWCLDHSYSWFNKVPTLNLDKVKELTAANWICSIENLERDFGYHPEYTLENGIQETITWYKKNNWL